MTVLPASAATVADSPCPLFVDLDGTLVETDTLYETALSCLRRDPASLLRWPGWLLQGRAQLKAELASRASVDVGRLPYDQRVCDLIREERAAGRRVYLATAADESIARSVADHLGFFDGVIASDGRNNLKGSRKLEAISAIAQGPFAYAGNGAEDVAIWPKARESIVVNASTATERAARSTSNVTRILPSAPGAWRDLWRAMRPHQWVKNLLILVPLLTAFRFADPVAVVGALLAFAGFSLCASASYILNDLLDLDADRAHPRKRERPFASGRASIQRGLLMSLVLLLMGLGIAAAHSLPMLLTVASYVIVTTSYSLHLKHFALLDVLLLSALYTWRLFAGTLAARAEASVWLLAFSLCVFLSLALLKRCAELVSQESAGGTATPGRDYRVSDLRVLWPLGVSFGVSSVVVFILYATAPEVRARFGSPTLLWLVSIGLVYWLARMWLKTSRGEMTDDPIVYAAKDFGSRITIGAMVMATIAAHFVHLG